jgi:hypothetical protein
MVQHILWQMYGGYSLHEKARRRRVVVGPQVGLFDYFFLLFIHLLGHPCSPSSSLRLSSHDSHVEERPPLVDPRSGEKGESSPPEGRCCIQYRNPSRRGAIFPLPNGETSIRRGIIRLGLVLGLILLILVVVLLLISL